MKGEGGNRRMGGKTLRLQCDSWPSHLKEVTASRRSRAVQCPVGLSKAGPQRDVSVGAEGQLYLPLAARYSLMRGGPFLLRNFQFAVPCTAAQPCPDIRLECSFTLHTCGSFPHFLRPRLQRYFLEEDFPDHPK